MLGVKAAFSFSDYCPVVTPAETREKILDITDNLFQEHLEFQLAKLDGAIQCIERGKIKITPKQKVDYLGKAVQCFKDLLELALLRFSALEEEVQREKFRSQLEKTLLLAHMGRLTNPRIKFGINNRLAEAERLLDSVSDEIKAINETPPLSREIDLVGNFCVIEKESTIVRDSLFAVGQALSLVYDLCDEEHNLQKEIPVVASGFYNKFRSVFEAISANYKEASTKCEETCKSIEEDKTPIRTELVKKLRDKLDSFDEFRRLADLQLMIDQINTYKLQANIKLTQEFFSVKSLLGKFKEVFVCEENETSVGLTSSMSEQHNQATVFHGKVVSFKEGVRLVQIWDMHVPLEHKAALYQAALTKLNQIKKEWSQIEPQIEARIAELDSFRGPAYTKREALTNLIKRVIVSVHSLDVLVGNKTESNIFSQYEPKYDEHIGPGLGITAKTDEWNAYIESGFNQPGLSSSSTSSVST